MAKKPKKTAQTVLFSAATPADTLATRHRRPLFLPNALKEMASRHEHRFNDALLQTAHEIAIRWADLETGGKLTAKETSLDAEFLQQVFGEGLGYAPRTDDAESFQLDRQFHVPDVGYADGALGRFRHDEPRDAVALIELKSADVRLDVDRFNGRTPVQQCWDYLNGAPKTPWGIVSNFVLLRLYHRNHAVRTYEEFKLQDLRDRDRFLEFYCIFGPGGLLPTKLQPQPRAELLLEQTNERQREVGDQLYVEYSRERLALIDHLHFKKGRTLEQAIAIAQKLMDRIIFIAFCEDRELLPSKTIDRTYREVPPLARVTNPRWQNFLDLFAAVHEGHARLNLMPGYNGGLFRHDPDVDDLQLDDGWTDFFQGVGEYDFRDEINVDVLGHLFEKSVTEIEKIKTAGLFDTQAPDTGGESRMPKSAKRKRFGIYYTPPEFTALIVGETIGAVVDERFTGAAAHHGIDLNRPNSSSDKLLLAFWRDALEILRKLRVCDPACGSGAFLISAYEFLEGRYAEVLDNLHVLGDSQARTLAEDVPDTILRDNLYGVDLSQEAVEISQLALWIRSARLGRTLADLSHNVVWGNSLVDDRELDPQALSWKETFPAVCAGKQPGFDCVIGNPPWERLKLQEREHFALSAPKIAGAVSAADRRKLIEQLVTSNPELHALYLAAKDKAERVLAFARTSRRFPLTAKGDINTYALFAELAHTIVAPSGRVGLLVPSGLATDKTTKDFFNRLTEDQALIRFYDFENRRKVFPDVDGRFKFSAMVFGGSGVQAQQADFVFFAHSIEDLQPKARHIALTADDMALMNPNTRTCPVFRTRRDADLTRAVYRRVPVLIDRTRRKGGNPWGIRFATMFHQTNDAELFHAAEQLTKMKFRQEGNHWRRGKRTFLPLYEAKMVQAYDHRAASVIIEDENWFRQGQTKSTSEVQHQNPEFVVQPRWWAEEQIVRDALGGKFPPAILCFKNVTSPTNERTMIASFIPAAGVVNSAPLVFCDPEHPWRAVCCLLANLNSFALDFIARQKVGNVHLNFFIVEQLPILAPDRYGDRCPWSPKQKLRKWISDRVLKLTCTAEDMLPFAEAAGFKPGIHKWRAANRVTLRAELDAAYFHLYGFDRDSVEHVLASFTGTERRDQGELGTFKTAEVILEAFDRFAS